MMTEPIAYAIAAFGVVAYSAFVAYRMWLLESENIEIRKQLDKLNEFNKMLCDLT
jgi:hypothetical protein